MIWCFYIVRIQGLSNVCNVFPAMFSFLAQAHTKMCALHWELYTSIVNNVDEMFKKLECIMQRLCSFNLFVECVHILGNKTFRLPAECKYFLKFVECLWRIVKCSNVHYVYGSTKGEKLSFCYYCSWAGPNRIMLCVILGCVSVTFYKMTGQISVLKA